MMTGALVEDIKKAWGTVNLLAHGRKVEWTVGGNLSETCWDELRGINLHWHDLRHEALSRLGESGELSDHELMEIAGHANLTTTQRYLNTKIERLKARGSSSRRKTFGVENRPAARQKRFVEALLVRSPRGVQVCRKRTEAHNSLFPDGSLFSGRATPLSSSTAASCPGLTGCPSFDSNAA